MAPREKKRTDKKIMASAVIVLLLLFGFLLFSSNGILRHYRLQQSLKTLQAANDDLQKQNKELKKEIYKLKNDPEYVEEIARKRYGLIKKNEMIFNFRKSTKKKH